MAAVQCQTAALLCEACQAVFRCDRWEYTAGKGESAWSLDWGCARHHPTRSSFNDAVTLGCQICTIIQDSPALQTHVGVACGSGEPFTYAAKAAFQLTRDEVSRGFALDFTATDPRAHVLEKRTMIIAEISLASFELVPPGIFPARGRAASDCANSPGVVEQIRGWISECIRNHTACGTDVDLDFKPTRLLDLGEAGTENRVRLVLSSEHFRGLGERSNSRRAEEPRHYATLSHCWGVSPMFKLEKHNVVDLFQSIEVDALPKTFRQAIQLSQSLGVRYLWIDALCIIQGSEEDWLKEGAMMADVYKNAYCNIAATSSSDSSGGLFFRRNPNLVATTLVKPAWEEAGQRQYVLAQGHRQMMEQLNEEPLLNRAWVLQERLLAARVVHLTTKQVFFECHTRLACETYPAGIPDPHGDVCVKCRSSHFIHRHLDPGDEQYRGVRKEIAEWNSLVERYTACALTYGTDKLPALSGIATHYSRRKLPGVKYLAGIWECQFPLALMWRPRGDAARKPSQYRAPSWSWASMDGLIDMKGTEPDGGCFHAELAEVWDAEVNTRPENVHGPVSSAFLRLLAPLAKARVIWEQNEIVTLSVDGYKILQLYGWSYLRGHIRYDVSQDQPVATDVPIVFIQYVEPKVGSPFDKPALPYVSGLVLEACDGGAYKRLGTFQISGRFVSAVLEHLQYPRARWVDII